MEIKSAVTDAAEILAVWGKCCQYMAKCEYFKTHSATAGLQLCESKVQYENKNVRYKLTLYDW